MNKGQEDFLGFLLERVADEGKDKVKDLMSDAFQKHSEGKFDLAELSKLAPKLHELVKPEHLNDVKQAMEHFAGSLKK